MWVTMSELCNIHGIMKHITLNMNIQQLTFNKIEAWEIAQLVSTVSKYEDLSFHSRTHAEIWGWEHDPSIPLCTGRMETKGPLHPSSRATERACLQEETETSREGKTMSPGFGPHPQELTSTHTCAYSTYTAHTPHLFFYSLFQ